MNKPRQLQQHHRRVCNVKIISSTCSCRNQSTRKATLFNDCHNYIRLNCSSSKSRREGKQVCTGWWQTAVDCIK